MGDLQQQENKHSAVQSDSKAVIERRLGEAGLRIERCVSVENGTKACTVNGHTDPDTHTAPTKIDGNYTVHGGSGLVLIDIDVQDTAELPKWVRELPSTLVVKTPHGGYHRYYRVPDDDSISNTNMDYGEVRYTGQYVVGPGSTLNHDSHCSNCGRKGASAYGIKTNEPIAELCDGHLDKLRDHCNSDNDTDDIEPVDAPNQELLAMGEKALEQLQSESVHAFRKVMNFLQGGTSDFGGHEKDGGKIDRSAQDYTAVSLLYGALERFNDTDEQTALAAARATYTEYCREHARTKDGQERRWTSDSEDYRRQIAKHARNSFDEQNFRRLLSRGSHWSREHHDEYSPTTIDLTMAVLDLLCRGTDPEDIELTELAYGLDLSSLPRPLYKDMTRGGTEGMAGSSTETCPYPKPGEVSELLAKTDRNSKETFENVLRELRRDGHLKLICIEQGVDYRVCREGDPEPEGAQWVRTSGEKRPPQAS